MNILRIIIGYFLTLSVFLALDFLWLGFLAKNLYKTLLGNFLTSDVNWAAAGVFYLIFVAGILVFVVNPALGEGALIKVVLLGALFGLVAYATYDLTNLATIQNWPLKIVLIDLAWGSFISSLVSVAGYYIFNNLLK